MTEYNDEYFNDLAPRADRYDTQVGDDLVITVFPNGIKTWVYAWLDEGYMRRKTIGLFPQVSYADALAALEDMRAKNQPGTPRLRAVPTPAPAPKAPWTRPPVVAAAAAVLLAVGAAAFFFAGDDGTVQTVQSTPLVVDEPTSVARDQDTPTPATMVAAAAPVEAPAPEPVAASGAAEPSPEPRNAAPDPAPLTDEPVPAVAAASSVAATPAEDEGAAQAEEPSPAAVSPAETDELPLPDATAQLAASSPTPAAVSTAAADPSTAEPAPATPAEPAAAEPAAAEPAADEAAVLRAALTSEVRDREPVDRLGPDIVGPADWSRRVFFFTELRGFEGRTVMHRWFLGDEMAAEVPFTVRANWRWRVFSSKTMEPGSHGDWRVEAVADDGTVLHEERFSFLPDETEVELSPEPEGSG